MLKLGMLRVQVPEVGGRQVVEVTCVPGPEAVGMRFDVLVGRRSEDVPGRVIQSGRVVLCMVAESGET